MPLKQLTQSSALSTQHSTSPNGESFPLPKPEDYDKEFRRLKKLVAAHRKQGREIVVVMGVGFVGAVMAGVIADSVQKPGINGDILGNREASHKVRINGDILGNREAIDKVSPFIKPTKFVIAMQRPSPRSYWKIPYLNRGIAPVESEDPEVAPLIARCVNEKKTLTATFTYVALTLADVVVVDVQCDYFKEMLGNCRQGRAEIAALEESLKIIGEKIQPHCLVLIETTVPPGTTEYVAYPILKKAFERRFPSPAPSALSPDPPLSTWFRRSWASTTTSSRSRPWRSTSTTPAPSTRPSSSATPCATWGGSSLPRRSPSSAPPTGRMWWTPATVARRSW